MAKEPMTVPEVLAALNALRDEMPALAKGAARRTGAAGDVRDGSVYLMDEQLMLAVQVAVATARPLLLTGDPGTGKSSLAAYLAARLSWRYYEHVVTGRTEANDLLWEFDTVRRLGDATGREGLSYSDYVEPGVLWWAFDPKGARSRGATQRAAPTKVAQAAEPLAGVNAGRSPHHAVVLIDEIDKADPDVPNALLVPLGSNQFVVRETQAEVRVPESRRTARKSNSDDPLAAAVLIVITSNGERDLPPAFLRRCVAHHLASPDSARLEQIAKAHAALEGRKLADPELKRVRDLAAQTVSIREELRKVGRKGAGTAEFLDAVHAARDLRITAGDAQAWDRLISLTLRKGVAGP
jgi:MoxR-like ATPase